MRRRAALHRLAAITLLSTLAVGCAADPSMAAAVGRLESELMLARAEVEAAQSRLAALEAVTQTPVNYDEASFAFLGNPTEPGFAVGRTGYGKFLVVVDDIKGYGSGSRMTLRVINLASATLSGAVFTVSYNQYSIEERLAQAQSGGKPDQETVTKPVTHRSTLQFPPGRWTTETITLPELPPDQVKFVAVKFAADTVAGI